MQRGPCGMYDASVAGRLTYHRLTYQNSMYEYFEVFIVWYSISSDNVS